MPAARELIGCSDRRGELHALLLRVEEAHKADILTYCFGHLNPGRKAPSGAATMKEPKWLGSLAPEKSAFLQQHARMRPEAERMKGLTDISVAVSASLVTSDFTHPEEGWKNPCHLLDATGTPSLKTSSTPEPGLATGGLKDRSLGESLLASVTLEEQRQMGQEFEYPVLKMQDLREPKGLGWSEAAKKQERRLEQVLKKLRSKPLLGRERLQIIGSMFDDLCDESQVFGPILKEIKTEYDHYLNLLLISGSDPQNTTNMPGVTLAGDLEETQDEVLRLEHDARKALTDNDQARMELKRRRDQVLKREQKHRDQKQGEVQVSPSDQVLLKRHQVWTVLEEIQLLEDVIRKQMTPKDAVRGTERYIRDVEAEIMVLSSSNKQLYEANEHLHRNISSLLDKMKVTSDIQGELWKRI